MSKTTSDSMATDVQPQTTTEHYPSEPTVEVPLALARFIRIELMGLRVATHNGKLMASNGERLANVSWALASELGDCWRDDIEAGDPEGVDIPALLAKYADGTWYDLDDLEAIDE